MNHNPLSVRRKERGHTQEQMAVLLKTVQSEVAKTEAGELPPESDIGRWAKAYGCSRKKFVADCEAAQWVLPLWRTAVSTPRQIETIDCRPERSRIPIDHPECDQVRKFMQA